MASVGTSPWELVLWRAADIGAPVDLLCPVPPHQRATDVAQRLAGQFGLARSDVAWTFLPSRKGGRCKDTWLLRDELAWRAADLVLPVSVRPGGRWSRRLSPGASLARLDCSWSVPWQATGRKRDWQHASFGSWPDEFDASGGALIHFTRGCPGPWPGERAASYYQALSRGGEGDPRDGLRTLERILAEKRIRGSSLRIRGRVPVVCFTAMTLAQTGSMFRWRSRYARFSVEPYGIALSMSAARGFGARPVRYDKGSRARDDAPDRAWRQGSGDGSLWEHEQEWRIQGDVDLSLLASPHATVLVPGLAEARALTCQCPFPLTIAEEPTLARPRDPLKHPTQREPTTRAC